ncbi:MAG: TolC family protein [Gemmatimonadales bacterium]|nr:MAG: TolC family protein [Gemmatimonadales bacterium]
MIRGGAGALVVGLAVFMAGPPRVLAQEPTQGVDVPVITLEEARARALGMNPGIRQSTNNLELNAIERREAWLGLLPQPSITVLSTNMSWQRQTLAEDNFGEPLEREIVETVQTSRSNQGAALSFNFNFNDILRIRDQRTQAELRTSTSREQEHTLLADVALAYFDVQEQASALALEEELVASAREARDVALRLYSLGRRERTDVLSAELDVAERESQLEDLRSELEGRRLDLRTVMGDPDVGPFQVEEADPRVFDPTVLDEEALLAEALASSPRIREARLQLEVADRSVTMARAEWLPTLTLNLNTNRQEFLRSGDAFFQVAPDGQWSRNVSLGISLPDPGQYFNRQNSSRTRQISLENQAESMRQVELELDRDVRSQLSSLRSAHRSVELQTRRVELAEENLEESLESYRLGRTDFLQLQSASEQAAQARRQELQTRFQFQRIRIQLERVLGTPLQVPEEGS